MPDHIEFHANALWGKAGKRPNDWKPMDYDLIVIGSGRAGGKAKRKVLVIDRKSRLGGVSVYTGTIPSKTLRETVLN